MEARIFLPGLLFSLEQQEQEFDFIQNTIVTRQAVDAVPAGLN